MTFRSERVQAVAPRQCQYPSDRMINLGGCTYGTMEERAEWRRRHVDNRNRATGLRQRDPAYCTRSAKWSIDDGPHLCSLHAGAEALEIIMTGRPAPEKETTDMPQSVPAALGLAALLADNGALANLRGHARRIADDIAEAARETGGRPARSGRYLDAVMIVSLVDQVEQIADGTFTHNVPAGDVE